MKINVLKNGLHDSQKVAWNVLHNQMVKPTDLSCEDARVLLLLHWSLLPCRIARCHRTLLLETGDIGSTAKQAFTDKFVIHCHRRPPSPTPQPYVCGYAAYMLWFHFKYYITEIALSQFDGTRKVLFILEKTLSGNTNSAWPHLSIIWVGTQSNKPKKTTRLH